jgi:type IV pilus assembly protein PilA
MSKIMWYYVDKERQQRGPVTVEQLRALFQSGDIHKRTHLWQEGRAEWTRLEDLAGILGIAIAAPPPTPPPTAAMARPIIQSIIPPQPMAPSPQAAMPHPVAIPQTAPPPFAPPGGFAPPQPAFPQAPGVYTPPQTQSSGCAKYLVGALLIGLLAVGVIVKKFGTISFGTPTPKERLSELVSGMQPVRAEVEKIYKKTQSCPDANNPLPKIDGSMEINFFYGAQENTGHCYLSIELPADYEIKELASTELMFVYDDFEAWRCGMNAAKEFVPSECEKY